MRGPASAFQRRTPAANATATPQLESNAARADIRSDGTSQGPVSARLGCARLDAPRGVRDAGAMLRSRALATALLAAMACGPGGGGDVAAPPKPSSAEADLAAARLEVATLRQALSEERTEREALEAEVERLRQQLDDLAWRDEAPAAEPGGEGEKDERGGGAPWFDAESLGRHGVQPA